MANITVDITTLSNYSSISLGSHQLTVVAKAPGFLDSNPSTAVTFVNGYELVFDTISNCTYTPSPSMISAFDSTTITFTPDAHYVLPDSIYVGGTADHTWDKSTGRLVLSNVKSNITLECEATLETFPVTISATGCTYSPTGWTEVAYGEGGEIWLQNVNSGYRLPDSVTVTGASYEYNKDSGFIRISNATGPVTVTITCVQIYTITANITNGSWSGDTQVDVGASAMGVIMPNSGYSYPTTVSATNATVNYSSIDGSLILADITGNVVITAECLTQLATPANVSADGTTVSWDEVENATSYVVLADGSEIGTVEKETGFVQIFPTTTSDNYTLFENLNQSKVYTTLLDGSQNVKTLKYSGGEWHASGMTIISQTSNSAKVIAIFGGDGRFLSYESGITLEGDTEATTADFDGFSSTAVYAYWSCFVEGTKITLSDGSTKPVQDIQYGDKVLCYDFTKGVQTVSYIDWMIPERIATKYWEITLSDGTILNLVGSNGKSHRLYNITKQRFDYPQDFEKNDLTLKEDGTTVYILSCREIEKEVKFYNIASHEHINVYANGVLTSNRLNNRFKIVDNKFTDEKVMTDEEVADYCDYLDAIKA